MTPVERAKELLAGGVSGVFLLDEIYDLVGDELLVHAVIRQAKEEIAREIAEDQALENQIRSMIK